MGWWLSTVSSYSRDEPNNQSTITVKAYLNWNGWVSYAEYYNRPGYITIGDASSSFTGPDNVNAGWDDWNQTYYSINETGSQEIGSWSRTYNHNTHGQRGAVGTSASYSGGGGYAPGNISADGGTQIALDYSRPPNKATTPTLGTRVGGSSSISMSTSATVPSGGASGIAAPGVSGFHWQRWDGSNWVGIADASGSYTWPSAGSATDYLLRAIAYSSEGDGPASDYAISYAAPYISAVSLPVGTVGKPYSGTITGVLADSYSAINGSLPPGVIISGPSIVGTPTVPGTYSFTIRATRAGVATYDSAQQTIQVLAGGPWVYLTSPWVNTTITNVSLTNNIATITTAVNHGITEVNQPITISGLTGAHAVLNGTWPIRSDWTANTVSFALTNANIPSAVPIGTGLFKIFYKRSSIKVNIGTPGSPNWVQGYMRVYDTSYTNPNDQTHWRNTA